MVSWDFVLVLVPSLKVIEFNGIRTFSHTEKAVAFPLNSLFDLDVQFYRVCRESYDCSWEQEEMIFSDIHAFCMSETPLLMILAITETAVWSRKILNSPPTFPHG